MAYNKDFKDEVVTWMSGGRSANEAYHHFGIAHSTASRWYNEHMASIVVLAEPEAWEEIARWWEGPRTSQSGSGLCYSVTCLSNKMSISKGTSDTMHARITLLCKKRRKTDNWLYPEGENRAERAAIARGFAKVARRELESAKAEQPTVKEWTFSDEVPETIFDSNTANTPAPTILSEADAWDVVAARLTNPRINGINDMTGNITFLFDNNWISKKTRDDMDNACNSFPNSWAYFSNERKASLARNLANQLRNKPRVFVDLDGVLADFNSKAERILNTKDTHKWEFVHGTKAFWEKLDRDPNLFRDLKPMPEAWELWAGIVEILGEKPTILTAVPNTDTHDAAAQKRAWCKKYLGEDVEVITCSIEGKAAYCNAGDILIDDRAIYWKDWEAKGGKFLLYEEWSGTSSAAFCLARLKNMVSREKSLLNEV